MAEGDEIDVLSDFSVNKSIANDENFDTSVALGSQSLELLTCDYSTPLYNDSSTHSLWFSNGNSCLTSEIHQESLTDIPQDKSNVSEDNLQKTNIVNCKDSSGWSVKEKGLLFNGVQIFGKNYVYLSKFIGSKSADEVKFYLKHFNEDFSRNMCVDSLKKQFAAEIPGSIEEVMETVSTAKPTVVVKVDKKAMFSKIVKIKNIKKLKSNAHLKKPNNSSNHENHKFISKKSSKGTTLNHKSEKNTKNIIYIKPIDKCNSSTSKQNSLCGEEVIKIQKSNPEDPESDIDIDVDIESLSEDDNVETTKLGNKSNSDVITEKNVQHQVQANNSANKKETYKRNPEHRSRQRFKRKFVQNGEGGKTLTHGEGGEIIDTLIVDESSSPKKQICPKKSPIGLIYCRPFNEDLPQPFNVLIHVFALLLMDLHAHTCYTEVMGLLGGHWNQKTGLLTVTTYQPCRSTANSATHCDMCPVAQAKAADDIHSKGLKVVGWFHSHPTFAPEPSQQDIDTQLSLQQCLGGGDRPCLGIILCPYESLAAPTSASSFRCLIADKKKNFEDQFVPYKFNTKMYAEGLDVSRFLDDARQVVLYDRKTDQDNIFWKDYFLDRRVKHQEKFLNSVKMHLFKCEGINKMTCNAIIDGLENIISNY